MSWQQQYLRLKQKKREIFDFIFNEPRIDESLA